MPSPVFLDATDGVNIKVLVYIKQQTSYIKEQCLL